MFVHLANPLFFYLRRKVVILVLKYFFLKSAFIEAFEEIGGVDNLVEWARCNQTEFYRMLARLMPREIHADVNAGTSLVELLQEIDEREAKHKEC